MGRRRWRWRVGIVRGDLKDGGVVFDRFRLHVWSLGCFLLIALLWERIEVMVNRYLDRFRLFIFPHVLLLQSRLMHRT